MPIKKKSTKSKTVNEYMAMAPKEARGKLRELRRIIKSVTPEAEEKISYRMLYYSYKGRLAYFAAFQHHIGLYIPTPVIEEHARELKNYKTAKAAVHFPLNKKLPTALIKKLIKSRLQKNLSSHPRHHRNHPLP